MIYIAGVVQLALVTQVPVRIAILEGVIPFLLGDFVKVVSSALVIKNCHALKLSR